MISRRLIIVGGVLLLLLGIAIGWIACKTFTPECPEEIARTVSRETIAPIIPDGRTTRLAGSVKVKPIPAKMQAKPAKELSGGTASEDTPYNPITPPEVTIDSSGTVTIPITDREYITPDYRLTVRGYNPELTAIELYRERETITKYKPPRWALSVGPGCSYTPEGFQPGINVTLGFVIWSK